MGSNFWPPELRAGGGSIFIAGFADTGAVIRRIRDASFAAQTLVGRRWVARA